MSTRQPGFQTCNVSLKYAGGGCTLYTRCSQIITKIRVVGNDQRMASASTPVRHYCTTGAEQDVSSRNVNNRRLGRISSYSITPSVLTDCMIYGPFGMHSCNRGLLRAPLGNVSPQSRLLHTPDFDSAHLHLNSCPSNVVHTPAADRRDGKCQQ